MVDDEVWNPLPQHQQQLHSFGAPSGLGAPASSCGQWFAGGGEAFVGRLSAVPSSVPSSHTTFGHSRRRALACTLGRRVSTSGCIRCRAPVDPCTYQPSLRTQGGGAFCFAASLAAEERWAGATRFRVVRNGRTLQKKKVPRSGCLGG